MERMLGSHWREGCSCPESASSRDVPQVSECVSLPLGWMVMPYSSHRTSENGAGPFCPSCSPVPGLEAWMSVQA